MGYQTPFHLRVHDATGAIVSTPAGGPLEADLIATITAHVLQRPVGLFRTTAQVKVAIAEGVREAIATVKKDSRYAV